MSIFRISHFVKTLYGVCIFLALISFTSSCGIFFLGGAANIPVRQLTWEKLLDSSLSLKNCLSCFGAYVVLAFTFYALHRGLKRFAKEE